MDDLYREPFNPLTGWWRRNNGRVVNLEGEYDASYPPFVEYREAAKEVRPYPVDNDGQETIQAFAENLAGWGLFVSPEAKRIAEIKTEIENLEKKANRSSQEIELAKLNGVEPDSEDVYWFKKHRADITELRLNLKALEDA